MKVQHYSPSYSCTRVYSPQDYLADRLRQARSNSCASLKMIAELEKELQDGRSAAAEAASGLARLRDGKERDLLHVRASHIAELAATREEARREAEESNTQHARAIQEVQVGRNRCSTLPVFLIMGVCLTFAL